jgi:hypothetical protein
MSVLAVLFLSFVIVTLAVTAMAIGVMAGRAPIKGSCGGLNGGGCELCSGTGECRRKAKSQR